MREDDGDLQLAELLDSSFGAGPDGLPTPSERLATGQQALRRRRRAGLAGTTVAVVAVLGLGAALSGAVGGASDADGPLPPLATSGTSGTPSASATAGDKEREALERLKQESQQQAHVLEQALVSNQFPAALGLDSQLIVKDGWQVTQRVEEPVGYQPPEASLGVVVSNGVDTRWMLLVRNRVTDGRGNPTNELDSSSSADDPGKGFSRFEDWLVSMVELNGGAPTPPLVNVDSADRLEPGPGVTLVETRPAPVIEDYTTDGDRLAEVRRDGRTWFVVVRGHGPQAEVIPVDAEVLSAPTFAALVDHLTSQADSGEGVR